MTVLTWSKGSNYHIVSACRFYKVSKSGREDYIKYSAWQILDDWRAVNLGVFLTSNEAKEACQRHCDEKGGLC